MSTREALRTLTVNVATLLGVLDDAGTIDVGKRADLLVLASDPLVDPAVLQQAAQRKHVVQGGAIVHSRLPD